MCMRFEVNIWKILAVSSPEIRTWVEASDPVTAALSVMAQIGLGKARLVIVCHEDEIVGEFSGLEVSMPTSQLDCAVSYDYGLS